MAARLLAARARQEAAEREAAAEAEKKAAEEATAAADESAPESAPSSPSRSAPVSIPDAFMCPITFALMDDPVLIADGMTYERRAIEQWLQKGNATSPLTGAPVTRAPPCEPNAWRLQ